MFVAALVIALIVASEWARRFAIRGLCAATAAAAATPATPPTVTPLRRRAGAGAAGRVVQLRPASPGGEQGGVVAVPQWQRDT